MAMRHSRTVVFLGAMGALGLMTVLSGKLQKLTKLISKGYCFYAAFGYFWTDSPSL